MLHTHQYKFIDHLIYHSVNRFLIHILGLKPKIPKDSQIVQKIQTQKSNQCVTTYLNSARLDIRTLLGSAVVGPLCLNLYNAVFTQYFIA